MIVRNNGVSQCSLGVVSLAYAIVNGRPMSSVTMAKAARAMLLSSPAHVSSQPMTSSEATRPSTDNTAKKTAPNTSSVCTGTPRRHPTHRVSNVKPSAAEAASSNRPGPDTIDRRTHGAMPASGDLT